MNDNHLIVCGQRVAIGPMLAHMMLSSQDLQDRMLSLADQRETIAETHFPVAETGGLLTLALDLFGGFPSLMVAYIDDTYTASFEHTGGDSLETLQKVFDGETELVEWLQDNQDPSGSHSETVTLPFANRFGEYTRVTVTEIEAMPSDDGTWVAEGDVWSAYMDEGLQREAEASRKAA